MRINSCSSKSLPIVYYTQLSPCSGNFPASKSRQNLMRDTEVMSQRTKSTLISQTVSTYRCERVKKKKEKLLFVKILAVSIYSSTFQDLSALKEHLCALKLLNVACGNWTLKVITLPGALAV